jgi:GTP-binding protein
MNMSAVGQRKTGTRPSTTARDSWQAKTVEFTYGASRPTQLPRQSYPEIALAGRSNVGKSSLLNCLVHRSGMARVSKTPGRTQQINFFLIDGAWYLVDLPGYGFARVPMAVRDGWRGLVDAYLQRNVLRGLIVIVDLRRGVQSEDEQLLGFLAARGIPVCVAATKADKVGRGQRQRHIEALRRTRSDVDIVVCSAATGEGVGDVRSVVRGWLGHT